MYTVVSKQTGEVLAKNLTLDAVDAWVARNESRYTTVKTVGMTIFVLANAS